VSIIESLHFLTQVVVSCVWESWFGCLRGSWFHGCWVCEKGWWYAINSSMALRDFSTSTILDMISLILLCYCEFAWFFFIFYLVFHTCLAPWVLLVCWTLKCLHFLALWLHQAFLIAMSLCGSKIGLVLLFLCWHYTLATFTLFCSKVPIRNQLVLCPREFWPV